MENKLHISVSPHIHSKRSTQKIMLDVLLALLPVTIAGVVIFGITSLAVIAVCVGVAVLSEFLFNVIVKKQQTISDLSAAVTGLLLALNLPANVPLWQACYYSGSLGCEEGLLEVRGKALLGDYEIEGYMAASDIIEYME